MSARLISLSCNAEKTIGYCARVSNSKNQDNPDVAGLLKFCIKHGHWSIFEMANMVIEINTNRGIAAQILRHRYAKAQGFEYIKPRRQDNKNRQNSFDDLSEDNKTWFEYTHQRIQESTNSFYEEALERGIAKETARFMLPLSTKTRMYMNGTVRSWIHYIELRTDESTQKEHRDIADEIKGIFSKNLPVIANALGWSKCS